MLGVYKDRLFFVERDASEVKIRAVSLNTYIAEDDDYYPLNEKTSVTIRDLDLPLPELLGIVSDIQLHQFLCDFAWKGDGVHQPIITIFAQLRCKPSGRCGYMYYVTAWDIGLAGNGDLLLMKERKPVYCPTPKTRTPAGLYRPVILSTAVTSARSYILTFEFHRTRVSDRLSIHFKIGIKDNNYLSVVYSPELNKLVDFEIYTAGGFKGAQESLRSKRLEFKRFYGSVAGEFCRVNFS